MPWIFIILLHIGPTIFTCVVGYYLYQKWTLKHPDKIPLKMLGVVSPEKIIHDKMCKEIQENITTSKQNKETRRRDHADINATLQEMCAGQKLESRSFPLRCDQTDHLNDINNRLNKCKWQLLPEVNGCYKIIPLNAEYNDG